MTAKPKRSNKGKARQSSTPTASTSTMESNLTPSTTVTTETPTNADSCTLNPENIELGDQEDNGQQERTQPHDDDECSSPHTAVNGEESTRPSAQSNYAGEESMAMDVDESEDANPTTNDDDPFEMSDIEVPDDISEARATVKELMGIQELQLRKLLAIKRHIQQNPGQADKYEARLPDMQKILHARSAKIKDFKSVIDAYDAILAASKKTDYADTNNQRQLQESFSSSKTNGNRSYQQPAFLNIPNHWPRFRGPGGIANTQQYIDAFKRQVVPAINPEALLHDGARYLGLLINREEDVDAFNEALKEEAAKRYDVDTLERVFLRACITPEEREQSLRDMATIGRLPHESWKTFALRVQKKVNQFQVTGDTTYLVNHLLSSLPSTVRNVIRSGNNMEDPTTVSTFCDILSKCLGPDNLPAEPASSAVNRTPATGARSMNRTNRQTRCNICRGRHTTEDHIECNNCGRPGHRADDCNSQATRPMGTNQDQASSNGSGNGRHHPFRNNNNNTNRNFNNNNNNNKNNNYNNNNNNNRSQNRRWTSDGNGENKDNTSNTQSKLNVLTGSNSIHVAPKTHLTLNTLSLSTVDPPLQHNENETTDLALESIAHLSDSIFTDEEEDTRTPEEIEIDNDLQYLDSIFDKINIHNVVTDNLETITYSAMTVSDAQNRRIIVPLEFNNTVYDALLDTGASKSFIDRNIVEQAKLQIGKYKPESSNETRGGSVYFPGTGI